MADHSDSAAEPLTVGSDEAGSEVESSEVESPEAAGPEAAAPETVRLVESNGSVGEAARQADTDGVDDEPSVAEPDVVSDETTAGMPAEDDPTIEEDDEPTVDPIDPIDPIEPVDAAEPVDPIEPVDAAEPVVADDDPTIDPVGEPDPVGEAEPEPEGVETVVQLVPLPELAHAEAPTASAAGETTASGSVAELLATVVEDPSVVERLTVTGPEQVLPSVFHVTTLAATAVAAAAVGAARLSAARNGVPQPRVNVDTRHAAVAFRSERYITANRRPLPNPWDPLSGYYRTADDRWIQFHCNFPHHREGVLSLFGVPPDRARLERAVIHADSESLEGELQSMGMCATVSRTETEWQAHPQGRALARLPVVEIDRVGNAAPLAFVPAARPAAGVRVLDMTRVIAGPVCGRVLAAYGARVVRVGAGHLPEVATLLVDTGFGKRNTSIDLREPAGARRMRELVSSADVVIQAYRPKALARLGFGPEALARIRPGLVCVSISAYGRLGPWSGLRGFDSLVQTTSGIAHAGGAARDAEPEAAQHDPAVKPSPLPAQALDHATGYLGAYGAMAALARRQTEGGSWHVRLSLAQTGRWLQGLGPAEALDVAEPAPAEVLAWLGKMRSGLGDLAFVRPPGALSTYTPQWDSPPTPLGSAPPSWL